VIPTSHQIQVALHREELISLLRQISLFTADTNQAIRFSFSEGELRLAANTMEVGEGKVSMSVDYHGPHLEIAFNPGSFLDILRHCKSEAIYLRLTDAYTPGVIIENDGSKQETTSPSPLFVIMPMRLSDE
jgi:DNA polymerase-3 subunit beta